MVQVLALEVNLGSAEVLCHSLSIIEKRRSARIVVEQLAELMVELRVVFIKIISFFELDYSIHQCFGNVLSTVNAKSAVRVRHSFSSSLTAVINRAI